MPLIVDANVAALVFTANPPADFAPVKRAIFQATAIAVYGGKLAREYAAMTKYRGILRELDRRGVLRHHPDKPIDDMERQLTADGLCISDDPHVIALARVTGTRLLCSHDRDLHTDFTNPRLLRPAGSVYQNATHAHLLRKHCGGDRT